MLLFTLSDTPALNEKALPLASGGFLVKREYSESVSNAFVEEAAQWCVETLLHYHKEDLDYNITESYQTVQYMPIEPKEIVIHEGRILGFIRWIGGYDTSHTVHSHHVELLMTDPAQRKPLFNLVDQHCSERFDNDIYYRYILMRRSELPEGKKVEQRHKELVNVIY